MQETLVWSALAVGTASLVGSLHCVAMCGGFSVACSGSRRGGLAYHLGRLAAYLILGALAGAFGHAISAQLAGSLANGAGVLVGALLIVQGLSRLWGISRGISIRIPRWAAVSVPRWLMALGAARRGELLRGGFIGFASGFLPCGWLYSFVLVAMGTGSAPHGMAVMFFFWLGTVPALVAVAFGAAHLFKRFGRYLPVVSALLIILAGAFSLASHLRAGTAASHEHACH